MSESRDTIEPRHFRVRQIVERHGVSKAWVFARLADGSLPAIKVEGIVLIERERLDAFFANAPRWESKQSS